MNLNPSQAKAVIHTDSPLIILAGAGTGKTTVITQKIKHLIQEQKVDPYHIFAATFTHKASQELLDRLDTVMPLGYQEPWIGTFHTLCERILREYGLEIGLPTNFTVLSSTDGWLLFKEHLYTFSLNLYRPLGNPSKFITSVLQWFSRLGDEDISHEEIKEFISSQTHENLEWLHELATVHYQYQQLKLDHKHLDFSDLISYTLKLLRSRPQIQERLQDRFQHILVDEFQDTNYAQFQIIKLLAPPESCPNLTVVGDDDQSIYKFRGASLANILTFKLQYLQASSIVLTQNYRSTKTILKSAYNSITHNNPDRLEVRLKLNKQLISNHSDEGAAEIHQLAHLNQEIQFTLKTIEKHNQTIPLRDMAILTRSNAQLEPYAQALKQANIPYQLVSNHGLFDQSEILELINLIRFIVDQSDSLALFELLQSELFQFPVSDILQAFNISRHQSTSLWHQLVTEYPDHPATTQLSTLITKCAAMNPTQFIHYLINHTSWITRYTHHDLPEHQRILTNFSLFYQRLIEYERQTKQPSLASFIITLEDWLEAGDNPAQAQIEDVDTVSLLTVHTAKGLEFDLVFVGSLVAGRFPSRTKKDPIMLPDELLKEPVPETDSHIAEERRLFYVALTRAKRYLYLTYATNMGSTRTWKPSGFLAETKLPIIEHPTPKLPITAARSITHERPHLPTPAHTISSISYSQLDTFTLCPLKYKYRYLLKIPAPSHHSLSFGRTIHQTLFQFHQASMQGNPLTKTQLLKIYEDNFVPDGYESPKHKQARKKAGEESLIHYFDQQLHSESKPIALEQEFRLHLETATLVGKIDRIDQTVEGEQIIIDYKTGQPKDQAKVDKDVQLSLYALAARDALKYSISTLRLIFVEHQSATVTTTRSDQVIQKIRTKLSKDIHKLQTSDFPAKPDPVKCGFCEYRHICPAAAK